MLLCIKRVFLQSVAASHEKSLLEVKEVGFTLKLAFFTNKTLLRSYNRSVCVSPFIFGTEHVFHLIAEVFAKKVQPILSVFCAFQAISDVSV